MTILHVRQNTVPFYFCSSFVKPHSILLIFAQTYTSINLLSSACFTFYKIKTENQLKSLQYSACTTVKFRRVSADSALKNCRIQTARNGW